MCWACVVAVRKLEGFAQANLNLHRHEPGQIAACVLELADPERITHALTGITGLPILQSKTKDLMTLTHAGTENTQLSCAVHRSGGS